VGCGRRGGGSLGAGELSGSIVHVHNIPFLTTDHSITSKSKIPEVLQMGVCLMFQESDLLIEGIDVELGGAALLSHIDAKS